MTKSLKQRLLTLGLTTILAVILVALGAGNPIMPGADPHAVVLNGTVWIDRIEYDAECLIHPIVMTGGSTEPRTGEFTGTTNALADIRIRDPFILPDRSTGQYYLVASSGATMIFRDLDGRLLVALHSPNRSPDERCRLFALEDTGETLRLRNEAETSRSIRR